MSLGCAPCGRFAWDDNFLETDIRDKPQGCVWPGWEPQVLRFAQNDFILEWGSGGPQACGGEGLKCRSFDSV